MNEQQKANRGAAILIAFILFFVAYGLVGSGDVAELEAQAKVYDEMVCAGHWPDYEGRKPECQKSN